jgi:threonine aldolase
MRQAMAQAVVGDDVFGDDPTVLLLQERVAQLLGKEAALYVPSGTMANQLAVRVHCRPGDEAIVHARSHLFSYEGGAAAALSGVSLRTVDSPAGLLTPGQLTEHLHLADDPHLAPTRLFCLENTHNACGGRVLPQDPVVAVCDWAHNHGLACHLDGARLANAAVASGQSLSTLAAPFDSVSLCLSKGLGAPMGSLLAGPAPLIKQAWRERKRFGGGLRQAGIVAAAGLFALDNHLTRLEDDHKRARRLAEALAQTAGYQLDLAAVETNLVFFDLAADHPGQRDIGTARQQLVQRARDQGVWITGGMGRFRAVTHLDVDDAGIERAIAVLRAIV